MPGAIAPPDFDKLVNPEKQIMPTTLLLIPQDFQNSYGPRNDYSDDDDDRSRLNERRWSLGFKPFGNTAAVVH